MKNYYGKTYENKGLLALPERIFKRLRMLPCGLDQMSYAFAKRPCLLPAVVLAADCLISYRSGSMIPPVFLSVFIVVFYAVFCCSNSKEKTFRKQAFQHRLGYANRFAVMSCGLILAVVVTLLGYKIVSRLNASCYLSENGGYPCVITSVTYKLSGDTDITACFDGGALAKIRYRGDLSDLESLYPGDCLTLFGTLKEPEKAGNPGEFDYREYLRSEGILYIFSCDRFVKTGNAFVLYRIAGYLQQFFFEFRREAVSAVSDTFDDSFKALTAAVCTGDRSLLEESVQRDFKMSCCSHLLAVSGTHFAGFLACLPSVLDLLGIKRRKAMVAYVLFCVTVGCLTGWGSSVTRAAVMSICAFAARDWLSALSLASVVMVTADPFCPMSSAFQMSFCAVLAIKTCSGKITELLMRFQLGEKISSVLSVTVSASLGMMPFWSDISMRPDLEHLLIQIGGSFAAGACCTFFIPCVLLCILLPFWSGYLSSPLLLCLKCLKKLVSAGSVMSGNGGAPVHLSNMLLFMAGITVFLLFMPPCLIRRLFLKISAAVLACLVGFEAVSVVNKPLCTVVFADVGQGDCCLIMTPELNCLIDGGTFEEGGRTVRNLLDYYGIGKADVCIMSHWDTDHAGGLAALCSQGRTGLILSSYVPCAGENDKDVNEFFRSAEISPVKEAYLSCLAEITAGERIRLSDSVYIDVLYPDSGTGGGNEESLVVMLDIEGKEETKILFTGDIGTSTESLLIGSDADIDCDILKVAHHGSKYSTSCEFIEACSPAVAVISVGEHNFYGHPAPETLERLETYGCEVFRTDREGAVVLVY